MYYCPIDDNLLNEITSGETLKFKCPTCAEIYDATPEATMLLSDNIGEDPASKFRKFIKNSAHDPTNILVKDKCPNPKCENSVATHIRVTDQQKVLHTCRICGEIWAPDYVNIKKGASEPEQKTSLDIFAKIKNSKSDLQQIINKFIFKRTRHLPKLGQALFKKELWRAIDQKLDDLETIKKLRQIYKEFNKKVKLPQQDMKARAESRTRQIAEWLDKLKIHFDDFSKSKYLDIGCSEAGITEAVAHHLDILNKPNRTYATDIVLPKHISKAKNIKFSTNTSDKLDYPDEEFDLITAFMALHHFTKLDDMVEEIHRVMKPGATLIIREHDSSIEDSTFHIFLDFIHLMYTTVFADEQTPKCFLIEYEAFYKSAEEWDKILKQYGFKKISQINTKDLFKSYYAKYKKID